MKMLSAVLLLLCLELPARADRVQLGEIRHQLVGRTVNLRDTGDTMAWFPVKEKKGTYSVAGFPYSPASALAGLTGTISAVQNKDGSSDGDDAFVDSFWVIVKLSNGKYVANSTSSDLLATYASFVSTENSAKHRAEYERAAQLLYRSKIYLTADNRVYDEGLDISKSGANLGGGGNPARITDIPLLVPIPVVSVRYFENMEIIVATLQLTPTRRGLMVFPRDEHNASGYDLPRLSIPEKLTEQEIAAIRKRTYFVGMDGDALMYSQGIADQINDYGNGGMQVIYGSTYIYLDKKHKITDRQQF